MSQIIENFDFDEVNEQEFLSELRTRLLSNSDISLKHESKMSEDDKFLTRYLRKYKYDLDRSERAVGKYFKMIEKLGTKSCVEQKYSKEILDLCTGLVGGLDYDNNLVLMIPSMGLNSKGFLDRADENTMDMLTECIMASVFTVDKFMEQRNIESGVFIMDLGVIPYAQYCHKKTMEYVLYTLKDIVRLLPTIATKVVIVNAPWPFKGFLKFLMAFLKVPVEIIVISSNDLRWKEKLREHIPEESLPPAFGGSMKKVLPLAHLREAFLKSKN